MFSIFSKFQEIIKDVEVIKYESEDYQKRLHVKLSLIDNSFLVIRDYKFSDNTRKYSYHWMDNDGSLKIRWDNVPHWKHISTFPHHKHIDNDDIIIDSTETDFESVLEIIQDRIRKE